MFNIVIGCFCFFGASITKDKGIRVLNITVGVANLIFGLYDLRLL